MLKCLVVLGLFALAMSPMPGQTVKPSTQGGNKGEDQGQSKQGAPAPASSLTNKPEQPSTTKPNGDPITSEDKEHPVKLTGLPPITVTSQEKTVWDHILDWGPWVFNFGLVAVGILQIVLLKWTWQAIERQANIMDKGAKDAQESGAKATEIALETAQAAQNSADASMAQIQMMKDKERGRLRIEFGKVDMVNDPHPVNGYEVPFTLILDGATQVYIRENSCAAAIRETDEVPADDPWWRGMGLPTTITPGDRTFKESMTILTEEKPWGEPPFGPDEARASLVREEKLHVFVRAFVRYEDIFGGRWEARFNKKWVFNHDFFTFDKVDLSDGFWASIGDNGEYKVEQPQNPN
jgi:hypothetical protein